MQGSVLVPLELLLVLLVLKQLLLLLLEQLMQLVRHRSCRYLNELQVHLSQLEQLL